MTEHREQGQENQQHKPFGQILFDDVFLLLLLGLVMPFIIYTVWGLMDIGGIPTLPPTDMETTTAVVDGNTPPPQIDGAALAQSNGCIGCHSVDGSASVGPGWQGIYGSRRSLGDGSTVQADDAYLRKSITDPNAQVVEGYNSGIMPSYASRFSDEELTALVEYIKSLR